MVKINTTICRYPVSVFIPAVPFRWTVRGIVAGAASHLTLFSAGMARVKPCMGGDKQNGKGLSFHSPARFFRSEERRVG
ncbi:MAG: hypothetical protein PHV57_05905, partial [Methanomicrobiaceae archaeon]|nr:hypothetical protein [Methanomicrobiaceae archaeon]